MAENKKDIILLKRTSDGSIIDSLTGNELLTGELLLCYEKDGERLYAKNADGIIVPIHHVIDGEEIEYTPLPGVIYSDIEGATVLVNGSPIGTITEGKLEVPNGTINENDTISISGNTGTLPSNKTEYTFNGSLIQEKGNLPAAGGEITISDYVNVESTSTAYTYSYPTESITATTGMVTVELKAVEQTTPNASVPYQPTTYQVSENVTDSVVPHEITITQDESSKTYQFTLNQDAGVAASYTVNYDVEGATVLADNENVGTISGGTLTFQKWNEEAKDSFNITFSGGTMPEPQEAQYDFSVAEDNLEFSESGGTQNVTVTSTKVSYTSAHASGTVNKNDTLSLSHLETSASTNPSYSAQASGDGLSVNGNQITYTANSSTDGRSGSVTFTQSESSKQDVVNVSQEAKEIPDIPVSDASYADLVLWDGNKKIVVSGDDYSTDTFPTSAYTPIGVVVIPASHNVHGDGIPTMMSLVNMNCNTPESGVASNTGMYWGEYGTDISSLPNLDEVPYVGSGTTIGNTILGTTGVTYLPSDRFTTVDNPYDEGTGYYSGGTSYRQSPSPYVTGGGRNPLYYQTTSPSSTANCLADFDGRGNTDKILTQRGSKDYSSWKPTSNTEADYPAASCCDMFHTVGTNQGDWYLPSMGELGYVIARFNAINNSINKLPSDVNKLVVASYGFWSSSEYSSNNARTLYTYIGNVGYNYKNNNYCVRAFAPVQ